MSFLTEIIDIENSYQAIKRLGFIAMIIMIVINLLLYFAMNIKEQREYIKANKRCKEELQILTIDVSWEENEDGRD